MNRKYTSIVFTLFLVFGALVLSNFAENVYATNNDSPLENSALLELNPTVDDVVSNPSEADIANEGAVRENEHTAAVNSISGIVFHDSNSNGVMDHNEKGIVKSTVNLMSTDSAHATQMSTETDSKGEYEFTGLSNHEYLLCISKKTGWIQTSPALGTACPDGSKGIIVHLNGAAALNNNFGIRAMSTGSSGGSSGGSSSGSSNNEVAHQQGTAVGEIVGVKFFDINANGVQDANEPGLPGWNISISGSVSKSMITNELGRYRSGEIPVGNYTVAEVQQSGWTSTTPNSVEVVLTSDGVHVNFGNTMGGTHTCAAIISGMKFNDLNGNGVRDEGELGLSGWTITLEGPVNLSTTTDASGNYAFVGIPAGTYTVREIQQNDWEQTTPNPEPTTVVVTCASDVNFGNRLKVGSISGIKFNDMNGNGARDEGEPGLAGWTIVLSGTTNSNTTTDETGHYVFSSILAGTYTVTEVQQTGWVQTTANPAPINLLPGQDVTEINFGNVELAALNSISGMKFNDLNGNGAHDQDEPGLAGWTITLNSSNVATSTVTDVDGNYEFTGLFDDTYVVCEVLQSDWTQTSPTSGPTCSDGTRGHTVAVSNSSSSTGNNFGNRMLPGQISGMKFKDLNGNGVKDPTEPGLFGWTIVIEGPVDTQTTTDGNGTYTFTDLPPGVYTVTEVQQTGWVQTTPNPAPIDLSAGESVAGINFGNNPLPNSISGMKFNDLNGNGVRDESEPGLAGWTIMASGPINANTTTDGDGEYVFSSLPSGVYTVTEVQQAGWIQTTVNPAPINLLAGQDVTEINFGNMQQASSISGFKWEDINHNGVQDPGENRVEGWTIYLDLNNNGELDLGEPTEVTDSNGNYMFEDLAPGDYFVREGMRAGWIQITANPPVINLGADQDVTGINFGNQNVLSTNTITGMKFNDLNGNGILEQDEPGLSGWTITISGPMNGQATTDNSGNYVFTNLLPGTYTVTEVQQTGWTQTTPNPAAITVSVADTVSNVNFGNQLIPVSGSISGIKFKDLNENGAHDQGEPGIFGWTITLSGPVNAQATTDGSGNYIFTNLPPGVYTVTEVQQDGWTQTTANPAPIDLLSGQAVQGVDFGNSPILPNSIAGMKFNDLNGNGVMDEGEPGLGGWTITLSGPQFAESTVTDVDGNFEFTGLSAGDYTICEVMQDNWVQITPAAGPTCSDGTTGILMSVSGGGSFINNNFGNAVIPE